MKYAIISDIHSNLEALELVLKDIARNGVDKIICCGDVVGYGPNPKECIETLKSIPNIEILMGNHDAAIVGKINIDDFNDDARQAIQINRMLITEKEIAEISLWKTTYRENGILFVHGSPRDPLKEYLLTMGKLRQNMDLFAEKICFVGHTHVPLVYVKTNPGSDFVEDGENGKELKIKDEERYIINPGSVGQPRDEDARASFVYFDSGRNTIRFRRLFYDIKSVQKKMKHLNISEFLINRLSYGT